jgi:hypothetical protein
VPAFSRLASGVVVPTASIVRERMVLTKAQTKLLARCITGVLGPAEIKFDLACAHQGCPDPKIVRIRGSRGFVLRCGHADRILETAW